MVLGHPAKRNGLYVKMYLEERRVGEWAPQTHFGNPRFRSSSLLGTGVKKYMRHRLGQLRMLRHMRLSARHPDLQRSLLPLHQRCPSHHHHYHHHHYRHYHPRRSPP